MIKLKQCSGQGRRSGWCASMSESIHRAVWALIPLLEDRLFG